MKDNFQTNKKISIIIPAYECEDQIGRTVGQIEEVLKQITNAYELLVIIDGKDYEIYNKVAGIDSENIKIFHYEVNRGKGFAVKLGFEKSEGEIVGFIDGGGDISPSAIKSAIHALELENCDIVCGSKVHPDSKVQNYSILRKSFTVGYNRLVKVLLGINYKDTQTGLKFFRKEVIEKVLPFLVINKFAFDAELLAVADLFGYKKHTDIPIEIVFKGKSNAATVKSIITMFIDTVNISYRIRIRRSYQRKSKITQLPRELFNITFL